MASCRRCSKQAETPTRESHHSLQCKSRDGSQSAAPRPHWPIVFVFENADHSRTLAAAVTLHLHLDRIELGELGAGLAFTVESQHRAVRAAHVAPDAVAGLDFDLVFGRCVG